MNARVPRQNDAFTALLAAREHDPHRVLGLHRDGAHWVLRVFRPHATAVSLIRGPGIEPLVRIDPAGLFEWRSDSEPARPNRLRITERGITSESIDPYSFRTEASGEDLHLFAEGRLHQAYDLLGAHSIEREGIAGIRFRVWAPNAERVSVVGDFNEWDGRVHPLATLEASGVWELFVPGIVQGTRYKFELRHRGTGAVFLKIDPYTRAAELRPANACIVTPPSTFVWSDTPWLARRAAHDWLHRPVSIYEVHVGSWMRHPDGGFYQWNQLAERLIPYVISLGFTHIELMPITEHPLDESWGYQTTGYFAPTSRFGTPDDLRSFINACHAVGLGVILDWVPGHFPQDAWALAHYDGTALYEHEDPRISKHPDWGTHTFNFGRNEVRSFLLSSAHWWLAEFHFDGLRVDAVASMLHLDYSRKAGEWIPNRYGGRENLEAVDFLRELNTMVHRAFPGAVTIAEESTAWPMVSRPTYLGGLGFSMKWNMGWMHDTLRYCGIDPVYRRYHHQSLTFGQLYAYTENFVLPLSHDEVVHGKGALIDKMHGDAWQRFAQLRLLLTAQITMPGKKLLFMGAEFGQSREWSERRELDWSLLGRPEHAGVQRIVSDLNRLYHDNPALHDLDFDAAGFSWIDCHDADQSIVSFVRQARDGRYVIVALNFTPVPRHGYRLGVPNHTDFQEILNSDSTHYGGSNVGTGGVIAVSNKEWMGRPASIVVTLPPLGGVVLAPLA
ncbi:MAG: 1,4-alpha-glucan branching protein GlgB [Burkholderiales bacterium]